MYAAILIVTYLIGAIPFGLLLAKMAGRDIRKEGSGNIGATNVLRVCGPKWGVPALLLDMLKGAAPVLLVGSNMFLDSDSLLLALTGMMAIIGHTFPVYLKFKGGKGVATSGGALFALMPAATGIGLLCFAATVAVCRYVSVGSTVAAAAIVISHHLLAPAPYGEALPITIMTWLILALVVFCHRSNYGRLMRGEENRIGVGKKDNIENQ